jgi:hypothetical protein
MLYSRIVETRYYFNTCEMIVKAILLVVMVLNSQVAMAVEKQAETYEFTAEVSRYLEGHSG